MTTPSDGRTPLHHWAPGLVAVVSGRGAGGAPSDGGRAAGSSVALGDGDRVGFLGVDTEDMPSPAASLLADLHVTYPSVVDRDKDLLTELAGRLDELVSPMACDAASPTP